MLASAYNECDARDFGVQEKQGKYVYLLGDVDKGNKPLEAVMAAVKNVVPGTRALINSTSSATLNDKRWHITVPIARETYFVAFKCFQIVFFNRLEDQGLLMDKSLLRAAQLFFLPSKLTAESYYEWTDIQGEPYATVGAGVLGEEARRLRDQHYQREAQIVSRAKQDADDRHSVIAWVNSAFVTEDLLLKYGYEQEESGKEWASPHQQSNWKGDGGRHSTMVRPDGSWFSWSESDDDAGIGMPAKGGRNGDAFDLICHYAFNGEFLPALDWAKAERRKQIPQNIINFTQELARRRG